SSVGARATTMTVLLPHEEILRLHGAVVSARLVERRAALLAGLAPELVAGLPITATPGDQILLDLDSLNTAGILADGSAPLSVWLANAVSLAGVRAEAVVFSQALTQCHRSLAGPPALPVGHAPPNNLPARRLFVGRAEELRAVAGALGGAER